MHHHQFQNSIQNNFHRRALALVMEMMRCLVLASTGASLKIKQYFPDIDSLLLARLSLIYIVSFSGSQGNDPGSTSCRFEINQIFTQQPPAIRHVLNPCHLESNISGRATIDDFLIHPVQATLSPAQAARS